MVGVAVVAAAGNVCNGHAVVLTSVEDVAAEGIVSNGFGLGKVNGLE